MKSYIKKIEALEKKAKKKAEIFSKAEREFKQARKEYQDLCGLEVSRRYRLGQILVYEIQEEYRPYIKEIFAFGGVDKNSVEKYGHISFPNNCACCFGNTSVCSACEYQYLREANELEIEIFKTKIKQHGLNKHLMLFEELLKG